ncbi:Proteophosphoglycan ppg4 [Rhodotorula toruloides ATCC 204091]|uniref:Proteophosphoglycan ppg4 n=1 Tax=Rhodotorula toruloides TaxID=5286 RepID=A0A0K3C7S7_RHOTO|nr:Proteophosphoglycan ppg4 [Rhodotorula toruloides ATCC 204091]KAK4335769.1 Proteophosphoglycan ppg4 [Rhodotorula toruloides]PRQ77752.1 Proteophosphoglycan ppg4 [Rhodotorula toruloides]
MPPRASTSPRKKAGKATGAKKKPASTRCLITLLPSDLYPSIFHEAIDHDNFVLCRALLPYTLAELYRVVEISDSAVLVRFVAAIRRRPWLLGEVREIMLRDDDAMDEVTGEVYWETTGLLLGYGQLGTFASLDERRRRPYRFNTLESGIGLIEDLLRLTTRLESFNVVGMYFIRPLLLNELLQDRWPRLNTVILNLDEADDGWTYTSDAELVHNLAELPTLKHLVFRFAPHDLPVDLLNLGPRVSVPARSLRLRSFAVEKHFRIGRDIRILLAGLAADCLRTVKIEGLTAYPEFMHDLALLPPTVDHLDLKLGNTCPYYDRSAKHPKLANIAWHMPNLEHLHLEGDIVSRATFDLIYALPRLYCLSFSQHTSIDADRFLSLLRGGPSTWPRIRRLTVSICECPEDEVGRLTRCLEHTASSKTPNWPPRFGEKDAKQLVQICEIKDIRLSGSVLCATGECDSDDEHDCPGWRKEKTVEANRRKRKVED